MRHGFTMLEVLTVVVIMTMLLAIVGVRLNGPYQQAILEETLRRIEFTDGQIRNHAEQHGTPCQLVLDLDEGRLAAERPEQAEALHFEYRLPRSMRLDRVMTPWLDQGSGTVRIQVSAGGTSPTYAVRIATGRDTRRWVLFAGLTGRVYYPSDNDHVQQLFRLWDAAGVDAD